MTGNEIRATIERLRELGEDGRITTSNIVDAVFDGNNYKVRDTLVAILEQADPDTHMELPKDADGMPIHVGDEMQWRDGEVFDVVAIGDNAVFFDDDEGYEYSTPDCVRHYHAPTVEELLFEFGKICQDGYDIGNNIHEYATKLRELMSDD